jgi:hypothetical protein
MTATKVIIACRVFADELLYVLGDKEDVEIIWLDAGLHADLPRLEQELTRVLAATRENLEEFRLFMGVGCHPDIVKLAEKFGVPLSTVKNCLEAFLGSRVKELEQDRTMLMTPGWIRAWPGIMASLGWDEVDVRINLGRYNRILLLEPGINPLNDEEVLAFFDLVQVPIEVEPLDLAHFRTALTELLDNPKPPLEESKLTKGMKTIQ